MLLELVVGRRVSQRKRLASNFVQLGRVCLRLLD